MKPTQTILTGNGPGSTIHSTVAGRRYCKNRDFGDSEFELWRPPLVDQANLDQLSNLETIAQIWQLPPKFTSRAGLSPIIRSGTDSAPPRRRAMWAGVCAMVRLGEALWSLGGTSGPVLRHCCHQVLSESSHPPRDQWERRGLACA
jgi:hypothetical protein